jgi:hypothetical protein
MRVFRVFRQAFDGEVDAVGPVEWVDESAFSEVARGAFDFVGVVAGEELAQGVGAPGVGGAGAHGAGVHFLVAVGGEDDGDDQGEDGEGEEEPEGEEEVLSGAGGSGHGGG